MSLGAIVIHTAGDPNGRDSSAAAIRAYHKNVNGWRDIGYQHVVRLSGQVEAGRPYDDDDEWEPWEYGAQVKGANHRTLGICFTGNGDLADFTPAQKEAGAELCVTLCRQFHVTPDQVIGHHEADEKLGAPNPYKTCPGRKVDMDAFRELCWRKFRGDTEPAPSLEQEAIATELEGLAGRVRELNT